MNKDWTGNSNSIYKTLGASNHTDKEREQNDYYATEPKAIELLLEKENFSPVVWENAVGEGHLAEVLKQHGYKVKCSDIIDRGYPNTHILDFLKFTPNKELDLDIITNPPYKYAKQFVEKALQCISTGHKVAMFLKLQFLEGKERRKLFDITPPRSCMLQAVDYYAQKMHNLKQCVKVEVVLLPMLGLFGRRVIRENQ